MVQKRNGEIGNALQHLDDSKYTGIRDVFGAVLRKRAHISQPACTLFTWLAHRAFYLEILNQDCVTYIREIGIENARRRHIEVTPTEIRSSTLLGVRSDSNRWGVETVRPRQLTIDP